MTAAMAITQACASVKQNFDPAFRCPRVATPHESATFNGPSLPSQHKLATIWPPHSPNDSVLQKSTWLKNFWEVHDRASGGGGAGGGGGGGGGGGSY